VAGTILSPPKEGRKNFSFKVDVKVNKVFLRDFLLVSLAQALLKKVSKIAPLLEGI